jgi:hypothetical protein
MGLNSQESAGIVSISNIKLSTTIIFANAVISRLEKRFPGIKGQIEVMDVSTPVTYERYTAPGRVLT